MLLRVLQGGGVHIEPELAAQVYPLADVEQAVVVRVQEGKELTHLLGLRLAEEVHERCGCGCAEALLQRHWEQQPRDETYMRAWDDNEGIWAGGGCFFLHAKKKIKYSQEPTRA